jgi:hypothetical protein
MQEERKFLHDIASPLTTVQLNLDSVLMLLEDNKPEELPEAITLLQRCLDQAKRASTMIQARREYLISQEKK